MSTSVSMSSRPPPLSNCEVYPFPEGLSFLVQLYGQATMNLSSLNNPSPGSSVFDFPTHREPEYTIQTPHDHTRAPSSLVRHSAGLRSYIVISGGTGCNPICSAFGPDACYVLPISDDGGSSSEIIRVLGGPSIGACGGLNNTILRLTRQTLKVT